MKNSHPVSFPTSEPKLGAGSGGLVPPPGRRRATALLALAALAAFASGCGKRADLIAQGGRPDMASSCQFDDKGRLVVTILNQGKRTSKATTTQIVFGSLPPIRLPTRPIPPRESASVTFRVPEECFQPECRFQITADAKNEVEESDESNNSVEGRCGAEQRKPS